MYFNQNTKKYIFNIASAINPLTQSCAVIPEKSSFATIPLGHLKKNDILAKIQHGFHSSLPCETQLLEFVYDLHDYL